MLLAGLVLLVTHVSELQQFLALAQRAEPKWLLLAMMLQVATYVSEAGVWYLALRRAGQPRTLVSLVPLGIAKLFSDQAMPSGGVSGTAFFISALRRRNVAAHLCMATLLLSMITYYAAYVVAALVSILLLWLYHAIRIWMVAVVVVFALVAVGIPAGALWLRRFGNRELPGYLLWIPGLDDLMSAIAHAPGELLRSPSLLVASGVLHGSVFILDAATLWVMLQVVDMPASFWVALPSFVLASMVATVGPIPLGLGTFEVTCVTMLGLLGVPLDAALTATLLLRGFTLWLPMLPGMWLARRALR